MGFLKRSPHPVSSNGYRVVTHSRAASGRSRQASGWWHWLAVAPKWLLGGLLLAVELQAGEFDEYAVKAAYLYNFAKFVEWPAEAFADPTAALTICIAGDNPFGDALATLSGKMVESHAVMVRHIPAATGLDQCHIVFIGRAEQGRIKPLLAKLARLPILTVSDSSDFAQEVG